MHTHWRVDRNLESGQDAHLSSINALSPLALVLLPLFLPQLLFLQPINLLATLLTHSLLPSRQVKRTCPVVSCPWRRQDRTCSASTPMPAASCSQPSTPSSRSLARLLAAFCLPVFGALLPLFTTISFRRGRAAHNGALSAVMVW